MKRARVLLTLLFVTGTAAAHQDRILSIGSDGWLEGLPDQYLPARLTWSRSEPALALRIKAHETILPQCLTSQLSFEHAELAIHASWYHDEWILPPYIIVHVIHSKYEHGFFSGFSLLFNLDTGELIRLERVTATDSDQHYEELNVAIFCSAAELEVMVHDSST